MVAWSLCRRRIRPIELHVRSAIPDSFGIARYNSHGTDMPKFHSDIIQFIGPIDSISIISDVPVVVEGARAQLLMLANPVPITSAIWLFGSGLIGLVGAARSKKV